MQFFRKSQVRSVLVIEPVDKTLWRIVERETNAHGFKGGMMRELARRPELEQAKEALRNLKEGVKL